MASVVKKASGRLMRWTLTDPVTGALSKRSQMFDGTGGRRGALAEANRIEAAARVRPTATEGRRLTLRTFVETKWLPHKRTINSISTYNTDSLRMMKVCGYIGDTRLDQISGATIDGLMADMAAAGQSPMMRRHFFDVLRNALRQARRWKLIAGTPWQDATRPKVSRKRPRVAPIDESHRLALAFREAGKIVAAAYVETIADLGARPSEVLALMWDSIDLATGTADLWRKLERVKGNNYALVESMKTEGSARRVGLSQQTIETLRDLKAWHSRMHLQSGGVWPKDGLLFPSVTGRIWGVAAASRAIKLKADEIGVTTGSYSRRHGMASEMIAGGVPVTVVSERMGHASNKMTLDTYSHVLPASATAAVTFLNRRSRT